MQSVRLLLDTRGTCPKKPPVQSSGRSAAGLCQNRRTSGSSDCLAPGWSCRILRSECRIVGQRVPLGAAGLRGRRSKVLETAGHFISRVALDMGLRLVPSRNSKGNTALPGLAKNKPRPFPPHTNQLPMTQTGGPVSPRVGKLALK
jgi:hypothetical protein